MHIVFELSHRVVALVAVAGARCVREHRLPLLAARRHSATTARRSTPIRVTIVTRRRQATPLLRPVLVDPGLRKVDRPGRRPAAPAARASSATITLDVKPCTRYYLVAVKAEPARRRTSTSSVDHEEPISGCTPACPSEPHARRRCSKFDNLRVEFPTRRGTLRRARRHLLRHRARRDPRRGRRIGRRQVADRRGHHRPARAAGAHRRRRDPARRPAHRQPAVRGDAARSAAARSAPSSRTR